MQSSIVLEGPGATALIRGDLPPLMKAAAIRRYGGPDVIEIMDVSTIPLAEKCRGTNVIVKCISSTISPFDIKTRNGSLIKIMDLKFPAILGKDAAGIVVMTGETVTHLKIGDEVFGHCYPLGTHAEYALFNEAELSIKPKSIPFDIAACIAGSGVHAYETLAQAGRLDPVKPGSQHKNVLIHNGHTGTGHIAIQLAKMAGATVIVTTHGTENVAFCQSLGADQVINTDLVRFETLLKNTKIDLCLDFLGGKEIRKRSFSIMPHTSRFVAAAARTKDAISAGMILQTTAAEKLRSFFERSPHFEMAFAVPSPPLAMLVAQLVEQGKIKMHIQNHFSLFQVSQAHALLDQDVVCGKLVIDIAVPLPQQQPPPTMQQQQPPPTMQQQLPTMQQQPPPTMQQQPPIMQQQQPPPTMQQQPPTMPPSLQ